MKGQTTRVRSIASLGRALLLFLPIVCGCDGNRSRFIPDSLVGVWRTDDPRYRGRSLEFGKDRAVIGTGGDKLSIESVESVKIQPAGEETTYSIRCRTADGTQHFVNLRFSPNGDGEIRLSHPQNILWKRGPATGFSPNRHRRALLAPRPLYEIDCVHSNCSRDW